MNESTQNYVKEIFLKYGEKVQFKIGQSISSNKYISGTVFFIESGFARVILEDDNKLSTLKKVSTGYTVGAISILRGNACENVRASSNLIAISISDKEFKDIYDNDSKFRSYFDSLKDISEIIEFSKFIRNKIPNLELNLIEFLNLVEKSVLLINFNNKKIESVFKSKEIKIYRSSLNEQFAFKEIDSYSEYIKFKDNKVRSIIDS